MILVRTRINELSICSSRLTRVFIKNKLQEYYKLAGDKHIFYRALRTLLIVGSILNVINNPQIILTFSFQDVHISKVLLTYLVPYLVSTISAIQTRIHINGKNP